MNKYGLQLLIGFCFLSLCLNSVFAHCEIPCGIYDDPMRLKMLDEHAETIAKSMEQILLLEKETPRNYNQLVRWITNKEHHAREIQEIVTQYFMTQRIKPDENNYNQKLGFLHQILIYSMKCKQTVDLKNVNQLKEMIKQFHTLYSK